jgi:hypothetical protein
VPRVHGVANVAVLLRGDVCFARVAEVEEPLRIDGAGRIAEIACDKPAHVLSERDTELCRTRPRAATVLGRERNLDSRHHDGYIIAAPAVFKLFTSVAVAANEVVRFELLAGVRGDELEALEQFCSALRWVAVDESVARTAGSLA